MSKRVNITTLRKNKHFIKHSTIDIKTFTLSYCFLEKFRQLLMFKKLIISNYNISINSNKLTLNMALYYKTGKLQKLKKKKIINSINSKMVKNEKKKYFVKTLKTLFSILKQNNVNFKILVLNNKIKKKFIFFMHKKLKSYMKNLFTRKISTYVDILNLSAIFFSGCIEFEPLCKMLSDLFRFIQKRNHSKFFLFIRRLFKLLVFRLNKRFKIKNMIGGIKIKVSGRLKGKPRASTFSMSIGRVPIQKLSANIEYVKSHSNTPHYGTFGFKYWVFKNK